MGSGPAKNTNVIPGFIPGTQNDAAAIIMLAASIKT